MSMKFSSSAVSVRGALTAMPAAAVNVVNLAYDRLVGRHALPESARVRGPSGGLLAQEVSAVTWNRDSNRQA